MSPKASRKPKTAARPKPPNENDYQVLVEELHLHQEELRAQNMQLRETQHELEQSRDRYANLYDFAPVTYMSLDRNGIIEDVNLTGLALVGVPRRRLIGLPLLSWVAKDDRPPFLHYLHRCRHEPGTCSSELRIQTARGAVPVRLLARRETGPAAEDSRLRMAMIDLSEQRRLEAERRRAEAEQERAAETERLTRASSEAKDRFLASLSHELRTPLTPVLAAATGLAEIPGMPEKARRLVDTIRRNVRLEARLIDDLLDITRIVEEKLTLQTRVIDLHTVIAEAIALCAGELQAGGITCTPTLEATAHHLEGDPDRLGQVFTNLIQNARKFTPRGGSVTIVTRNRDGGLLEAIVTDTGIGMTPQTMRTLFKPFAQGAPDGPRRGTAGLGLGLAISKGLVEAHGGTISVFSEGPNTGSSFVVTLKAAASTRADRSMPAASVAKAGNGGPLRVLIVEDHEDSAEMLAMLLSSHGHEAHIVRTAKEALAASGKYDLLISDLGLPDRSGFELIKEVRRSMRVPAIALSGYGSETDKRKSLDAGFNAHLTKPVEFEKLLDTVARVTEK